MNDGAWEKLRIAKAKAADAEIATATFKPNLDQKSLRLALKKRMAERRRAASQRVASESGSPGAGARETSHPAFTPEINKRSSDLASTLRDGQGASVHERLHTAAKSRVTKYVENATPRRRGHRGEDANRTVGRIRSRRGRARRRRRGVWFHFALGDNRRVIRVVVSLSRSTRVCKRAEPKRRNPPSDKASRSSRRCAR